MLEKQRCTNSTRHTFFVIALSTSGTVYHLILLIFLAFWSLEDQLEMNTRLSIANYILTE